MQLGMYSQLYAAVISLPEELIHSTQRPIAITTTHEETRKKLYMNSKLLTNYLQHIYNSRKSCNWACTLSIIVTSLSIGTSELIHSIQSYHQLYIIIPENWSN